MEDKWAAVTLVGIFASMSLAVIASTYFDSTVDIEASKNGLQQCLIDNKILWKKECP